MAGMVNLSTWTGVVPVVLPWGEPTITAVGIASSGVAVPFFCYVIAMFMVIVPIWMNNFESDKQQQDDNSNNNNEIQNILDLHAEGSGGMIMDVPRIEYIMPPEVNSRSAARLQSSWQ